MRRIAIDITRWSEKARESTITILAANTGVVLDVMPIGKNIYLFCGGGFRDWEAALAEVSKVRAAAGMTTKVVFLESGGQSLITEEELIVVQDKKIVELTQKVAGLRQEVSQMKASLEVSRGA